MYLYNMRRLLKLREYQIEPAKYALDNDEVVLALAPNGGKTEVSIYVIQEYLRNNPNARVLILTHSTNVLKDNFTERMDELILDFNYSTEFEEDVNVHVCLPNSEKWIKGEYDLLVVDEAHENYLAERCQRIVEQIKPKKKLLLTGTPESFIREGGYNIYYLALQDIPKEYYAKLGIELVSSNYDWQDKDYNNSLNIVDEFEFKEEDTKETLERVLRQLLERLKVKGGAEKFNRKTVFYSINKVFSDIFKKTGKTLVYASNIKQADQIYTILKDSGVKTAISHSKCDKDSSNVKAFKNNEYDAIVVVDRAKLGYSDSDLRNIIDMSGTHNPSLIYQMLCRTVRGDQEQQNYFIKVTPKGKGRKDLTHISTLAALSLTHRQWLSTYNGRNFNGMFIVIEKTSKKVKLESTDPTDKVRSIKTPRVIFPEFTDNIMQQFGDVFKDVLNNETSPASIYKVTSIGEVRHLIGDSKQLPNGYWDYEKCKEESKKYTGRKEFQKGNSSAYNTSRKNNWLDDFTWLVSKLKSWTYEKCKEESKKYTGRSEFEKGNGSAYVTSRKNNWLDDFTWLISKLKSWDYEKCKEESKKYTSRGEFSKGNRSAYVTSLKNNWLDDFTWLPSKTWDYEKCKEESKKYTSRLEFQKGNGSAYTASLKNNWLDDFTWLISKLKSWDYEKCKEESKKYTNRGEFQKGNGSAYTASLKNNWLDDFTWLPSKSWTYEKCKEESKKYTSRGEFQKGNSSAYNTSRKNNWLDDFTWLLSKKLPNGYWDYEKCKEESKKYTSRKEFYKGNSSAYGTSLKNNWLDDFTWLPSKYKTWDYEKCKEESKKYTSRGEFEKGNGSAYGASLKNNWLDDFTWLVSKRKPVKHLETGKVYLTLVAGCNKTETPYRKEHGKLYKSSKTKQFKYITIEEYDRLKDK